MKHVIVNDTNTNIFFTHSIQITFGILAKTLVLEKITEGSSVGQQQETTE